MPEDIILRRYKFDHPALLTKEEAIRELFARLGKEGLLVKDSETELYKAILRREQLGSTAIGHGVAVPHVKSAAVTKLTVMIGIFPNGVEFDSTDEQPVYRVCLCLAPIHNFGLGWLERAVAVLRDEPPDDSAESIPA